MSFFVVWILIGDPDGKKTVFSSIFSGRIASKSLTHLKIWLLFWYVMKLIFFLYVPWSILKDVGSLIYLHTKHRMLNHKKAWFPGIWLNIWKMLTISPATLLKENEYKVNRETSEKPLHLLTTVKNRILRGQYIIHYATDPFSVIDISSRLPKTRSC